MRIVYAKPKSKYSALPKQLIMFMRILSWVDSPYNAGNRKWLLEAVRFAKRRYPSAYVSAVAYRSTSITDKKFYELLTDHSMVLDKFATYSFSSKKVATDMLYQFDSVGIARLLFSQKITGLSVHKYLELSVKDVYDWLVQNINAMEESGMLGLSVLDLPFSKSKALEYLYLFNAVVNDLDLNPYRKFGRPGNEDFYDIIYTYKLASKEEEIIVEGPVHFLLENCIDTTPLDAWSGPKNTKLAKLLSDSGKISGLLKEVKNTQGRKNLAKAIKKYKQDLRL